MILVCLEAILVTHKPEKNRFLSDMNQQNFSGLCVTKIASRQKKIIRCLIVPGVPSYPTFRVIGSWFLCILYRGIKSCRVRLSVMTETASEP